MKMLPQRPLTNIDLEKYTTILPNFRGIFMRDNLPISKPWYNECGIINLDSSSGLGSHWTAYTKFGKHVTYFDSFGNLCPPTEFVKYLGSGKKIKYNYESHQKFNTVICGHLCLSFLYNYYKL